jgi:hypothetical protein
MILFSHLKDTKCNLFGDEKEQKDEDIRSFGNLMLMLSGRHEQIFDLGMMLRQLSLHIARCVKYLLLFEYKKI